MHVCFEQYLLRLLSSVPEVVCLWKDEVFSASGVLKVVLLILFLLSRVLLVEDIPPEKLLTQFVSS